MGRRLPPRAENLTSHQSPCCGLSNSSRAGDEKVRGASGEADGGQRAPDLLGRGEIVEPARGVCLEPTRHGTARRLDAAVLELDGKNRSLCRADAKCE